MVVAIYYFLHQAGIRMKLFAFAIYTCGMLAYLGMMILEANVAVGAQEALRAIPHAVQSLPTQHYLGVRVSWVGTHFAGSAQPRLLDPLARHRLPALLLAKAGRDRGTGDQRMFGDPLTFGLRLSNALHSHGDLKRSPATMLALLLCNQTESQQS